MPLTALTTPPPLSVAPDGFVQNASDTPAVLEVTRFPILSSTRTVTAGVMPVPAVSDVGWVAKVSRKADPAVMLNAFDVAEVSVPLVATSV